MRVKTLLVPAAVTLLAIGGAATTAIADPGPNGNNTFGLCTAYFAGSETGQEHKRKAPPFAASRGRGRGCRPVRRGVLRRERPAPRQPARS